MKIFEEMKKKIVSGNMGERKTVFHLCAGAKAGMVRE